LLITTEGRPFYLAKFPETPAETRKAFEVRNAVGHPTVLMRRSAFEAAGGYRAEFVHAEDYDLWLRIGSAHEIANLPDVVGRYRIHDANASHRNLRRQALSVAAARAQARPGHDAKPGVDERDVAEILLELSLWWAAIGTRSGDRRLARRGWKEALLACRETADPTGNRTRVRQRRAQIEHTHSPTAAESRTAFVESSRNREMSAAGRTIISLDAA